MAAPQLNRRELITGGAAIGTAAFMAQPTMAASSPALLVPAEEDRHARTFMQWSSSRRVHPDKAFLDVLQQTIADIANTIAEFEPVALLAAKDLHAAARKHLSAKVELWDMPTEDLWCRDSGPLFAIQPDGKLAVSHIRFNGWGGSIHCATQQMPAGSA